MLERKAKKSEGNIRRYVTTEGKEREKEKSFSFFSTTNSSSCSLLEPDDYFLACMLCWWCGVCM